MTQGADERTPLILSCHPLPHVPVILKLKCVSPPHSRQVPYPALELFHFKDPFFFLKSSDCLKLSVSVLVHHLASYFPKKNPTNCNAFYLYLHLYFPHSLLSQQTIGSSLLKAHSPALCIVNAIPLSGALLQWTHSTLNLSSPPSSLPAPSCHHSHMLTSTLSLGYPIRHMALITVYLLIMPKFLFQGQTLLNS